MVTNAVVSSDGTVLWMYPALIKTYCALNVEYFPFDTQNCEIVFISWTFTGLELNISVSKDFRNAVYYSSDKQVSRCARLFSSVKISRTKFIAEPSTRYDMIKSRL